MKLRCFLLALLGIFSTDTLAQEKVEVKLIVVNRRINYKEGGLLIDVQNIATKDVAIYTPLGSLTSYVKFFKKDPTTQQYQEVIHPFYKELALEKAYQDSIYKASKIIVDFFRISNYNSKSSLYEEFITSDSLWFDYSVRNSKDIEKISDNDLNQLKNITGKTYFRGQFTLIRNKEHFQDFMNIAFIYEAKGDYKITLKLPTITFTKPVYLANTFILLPLSDIDCNTIYIDVDKGYTKNQPTSYYRVFL